MGLASGIHHLAITTADMKAQLSFFCDVLGAELKALYWMHGVPGAQHGFVKLNDASYVAFVSMPAIADIEPQLGVTHAGSGTGAGSLARISASLPTMLTPKTTDPSATTVSVRFTSRSMSSSVA